MPKVTTRKETRKLQREHYLAGEAWRLYMHTPTLYTSLEDNSQVGGTTRVCAECKPAQECYATVFEEMVHQDSDLKKRRHGNHNLNRPNSIHYWDIEHQNQWSRENMFDSLSNYLFCCACAVFGVSKGRIGNQEKMKRQQSLTQATQKDDQDRSGGAVVGWLCCHANLPWNGVQGVVEIIGAFPHSGYPIPSCKAWQCWKNLSFCQNSY